MAERKLRSVIAVAFPVRPGEGQRTALLFLHLLVASAIFILGRTVRDTLFLSRLPNPLATLPWMFVAYGLVAAVVALVYAPLTSRFGRRRVMVVTALLALATYLAVWVLVRADASWIYAAFYVASEVIANLLLVQFWSLANDLHDPRSAKRLFGAIGSARMLGIVIVGLGTSAVVARIGTAQLLFVLAALALAIAGLSSRLDREPRAARPRPRPRRHPGPSPAVLGDGYVRVLALVLLLTFVALTVGDYQFKAIARTTYRGDDLARFFSQFYAITGIVAFLFQILVTPALLARRGVGWGLSLMPALFGTMSGLLLASPRLLVATVMKFADNGLQYTIHDTTLQALYAPFPAALKERMRAFLDAAVKPIAYGLGGVALLVAGPRLEPPQLSWITVPVVLVWLALVPVIKRRYLRSLEIALSARGALAFDHEMVLDAASRKALLGALENREPRRALAALEQLRGDRSPVFAGRLEDLLAAGDPSLRRAAIEELRSHPQARLAPLLPLLTDPEPAVRAAAAAAVAVLAGDDAVEPLVARLDDAAWEVRSAAVAGLVRCGGVEGSIAGGEVLGRWLVSPERDQRIAAARALGGIGTGAYRALRRLLADPDPGVRRAALAAAPAVADPRLVPALVTALADPACRRRAGQALVAVGESAVSTLLGLLADDRAPRALRGLLPRWLRRIPSPASFEGLRALAFAGVADSHLRLRVLAALSHLRTDLGRPPEPLARIAALIDQELAAKYRDIVAWNTARQTYTTPLLEEEFRFRGERAVRRVLRILELRYDPEAVALARTRLRDPSRRGLALEVLDTLLEAPLRATVLGLVEDRSPEARLLQVQAQVLTGPVPEPRDYLREQCHHPNPYVAYLALDALAQVRDEAAGAEGEAALLSPEPLVREGGVLALAALGAGHARPGLEVAARDPDPNVAAHARSALARLAPGAPQEAHMYSTAEKILFLKGARVFERLAAEDLAPLARVAEPEVHAPGQTIFAEGELGDALYVIVRGKVAIRRGDRTLGELGPGEPFGEMAVLDEAPRNASAVSIEESELLRIGSEEFYEVLHEQVEIAEGVIRMLSARLRTSDAAASTPSRE